VTARRVVVASGAWSNQVLRAVGIGLPLTVTQEQVTYFQTPHLREFAPDRFPIWIWHGGPRDCFYGFPIYGEVATKAGQVRITWPSIAVTMVGFIALASDLSAAR